MWLKIEGYKDKELRLQTLYILLLILPLDLEGIEVVGAYIWLLLTLQFLVLEYASILFVEHVFITVYIIVK